MQAIIPNSSKKFFKKYNESYQRVIIVKMTIANDLHWHEFDFYRINLFLTVMMMRGRERNKYVDEPVVF